jgi:phosphoglycerate-specific signal transduction histidine kinase
MTGMILDLPENGIVDTSITSKLRTDFGRIRKKTISRLVNLKDNEMKQILDNYHQEYKKILELHIDEKISKEDNISALIDLSRLREEILLLIIQGYRIINDRVEKNKKISREQQKR